MRVLFVDDDLENVSFVASTLRDALGADARLVTTVEEAVGALHAERVDLLVMDLFIPIGPTPAQTMGRRALKYRDHLEHLGGLVLLDELDRVDPHPVTLLHSACRDHVLLDLIGGRVAARVPKPAPAEVLLDAVLRVIREELSGR